MGIFGSLFGKSKDAASPTIRDTLFGDMGLADWAGSAADAFPWTAFKRAQEHIAAGQIAAAKATLREVIAAPDLEPRHYLQAWSILRQHGETPPADVASKVLGVVVEVAMPKGLDLLAAYADHSARYYNFSGAGVVWEHPDTSLDAPIDELLAAAQQTVAAIGPWEGERPGPPPKGQVRLNFLTPRGLHFGQADMQVMSNDPIGSVVFQHAAGLMQALTAKS